MKGNDVDETILTRFSDRPIAKVSMWIHIVHIVRSRQRDAVPGRGVLPVNVQCWLNEYRAEQTLRKEMAFLARVGVLERIGGEGSRRGYRVVTH